MTLLLNDSADVAAMGYTEWEKLDTVKRGRLRLLLTSDEIPLGPVLLNRNIATATAAQIQKALLALHQSDTAALAAIKAAWSEAKQATYFTSITDKHYEPFLRQFGSRRETEKIIRQYVQQ